MDYTDSLSYRNMMNLLCILFQQNSPPNRHCTSAGSMRLSCSTPIYHIKVEWSLIWCICLYVIHRLLINHDVHYLVHLVLWFGLVWFGSKAFSIKEANASIHKLLNPGDCSRIFSCHCSYTLRTHSLTQNLNS